MAEILVDTITSEESFVESVIAQAKKTAPKKKAADDDEVDDDEDVTPGKAAKKSKDEDADDDDDDVDEAVSTAAPSEAMIRFLSAAGGPLACRCNIWEEVDEVIRTTGHWLNTLDTFDTLHHSDKIKKNAWTW